MSNILFLYDNLLDAATLTESSEATGFPVENIQHAFRGKLWTTGASSANVVIDLGSAQSVGAVALANYDWASAPSTLDLEFNATDAWGGPSETEALTFAANPTANGNRGVIVKTFGPHSYRYVRLNVAHSTTWSIGRMFLGSYFEPTKQYKYAGYNLNLIDPSVLARTIGGQDHADELDHFRQVRIALPAPSQAQLELFQKMWNEVGIHKDLFVAFDYDNEPDEMTMYGKFTGRSMPTSRQSKNHYPISLAFKESR